MNRRKIVFILNKRCLIQAQKKITNKTCKVILRPFKSVLLCYHLLIMHNIYCLGQVRDNFCQPKRGIF